MNPEHSSLPFVFLKPGEMVLMEQPTLVSTLLGSCVAVTMFNARFRIGAICHSLLPSCRSTAPCSHPPGEAGKFVECAIRHMLKGFGARGVGKSDIEAKLFGGSDMFESGAGRNKSIGKQNMEMALGILEGESIRLVTQDLGGERGRKIIFQSHTGEVFLKRLRKSEL